MVARSDGAVIPLRHPTKWGPSGEGVALQRPRGLRPRVAHIEFYNPYLVDYPRSYKSYPVG